MASPLTAALAAEIRAEMGRRNLTVSDLAAALNVHRVTASRIRNGHVALDIDQADRVAQWLDLDLAQLLDNAPTPAAST